jgi:spermidine synthase
MKSRGIQHIVEFLNCSKKYLNNPHKLEDYIIKGIRKAGLNYKNIISHQFEPIGVTILAIISESHIGLHTYPEAGNVSLDVFTCSNPEKQQTFVKYMRRVLKPKAVKMATVQRGNTIEFTDSNWITSEADYNYEVRYHVKKRIYEHRSKFQFIEIIQNNTFGKMLFLDGDLQIAEKDAGIYSDALIFPIQEDKKVIKNTAILGGGDGGILKDFLKLNPESVTIIDIDEDVVEASKIYLKKICKKAFEDETVIIVYADVMKYLNTCKKFDVIISDLTMHPEAFTNIERSVYLTRLFKKINSKLKKDGIFTLQCCSEYDKLTFKLISSILVKLFSSVEFHSVFIPSFCEEWIFAVVRK